MPPATDPAEEDMPGTFVRRATFPSAPPTGLGLASSITRGMVKTRRHTPTIRGGMPMCCLGRFVRETHTEVVPLFAWRVWIGAESWHAVHIGPPYIALAQVLRALGVTGVSRQPPTNQPSGTALDRAADRLFSLNGTPWVPNQAFHAVCRVDGVGCRTTEDPDPGRGRDMHAILSPDCSCGVYAVRRRDHLSEIVSNPSLPSLVSGMVALWGWVLEYEHGYRAEFAYPAGLIMWADLDGRMRDSLQRRARLYRVPVMGTSEGERGNAPVLALR